jgi:trimethylamine-N-oxide reductase (cytochrome c)
MCPDLNYAAAVHADKWIPVLPNTDPTWQLALAYIWITEGTYDTDYVDTHTYGFDKFKDYVLGDEDGVPKTPAWASPICGIPECTIKALAKEWASKVTTVAHVNGGSMIRGPYSHEPARLEVALLALQGVGKPGAYQYTTCNGGLPPSIMTPSLSIGSSVGHGSPRNPFRLDNPQTIAKPLVPQAILNEGTLKWYGSPAIAATSDQYVQYTFPISSSEGGTSIHMYWTDMPCFTTCWNGGNRFLDAMKSPNLECIVSQHPWLEDDMLYSDIILPVNTKFEEDDIGGDVLADSEYISLFPEWKCIEPIGESKSDYEAVAEIAKKLDLYDKFTQETTVEEFIKLAFDNSGVEDLITWEDFVDKGYYVVPTSENWEDNPIAIINFYQDPENNPLWTTSGKIEFYSQSLAQNFPDDDERPPVPHWIPEGETHQETLSCDRAKSYPLLVVSNHPRWRMHAEHDDISWMREIPTCKVEGPDGYMYEPVWLNPATAAERGIVSGDVVSIFNERGTVLGGAYVTERIMPGVAYMDHGSRCDSIAPNIDRGGANNLICPTAIISRHATGIATSGFLVQVEKTDLADLMSKYPEAFAREYDPAAGNRFNAWVEGGEQ